MIQRLTPGAAWKNTQYLEKPIGLSTFFTRSEGGKIHPRRCNRRFNVPKPRKAGDGNPDYPAKVTFSMDPPFRGRNPGPRTRKVWTENETYRGKTGGPTTLRNLLW
ncbi:MAG: hypothetical protein JWO30_681 [Fibrobacteres bacterium]|nr:hypothetical protein [Fibrobacterota bacterium]